MPGLRDGSKHLLSLRVCGVNTSNVVSNIICILGALFVYLQ